HKPSASVRPTPIDHPEAKMKNEDDEVKPGRDDNAASAAPPRPTRRQFLMGLTTGTEAIGG
ncbi:MAG: hypothetical protein WBW78_22705, partial [Terrimicrobiaceae bacterium]